MNSGAEVKKKYNQGWILIIMKNNTTYINTSLYDDQGKIADMKIFELGNKQRLENFQSYVRLFEDNPSKNIQKMIKIGLV